MTDRERKSPAPNGVGHGASFTVQSETPTNRRTAQPQNRGEHHIADLVGSVVADLSVRLDARAVADAAEHEIRSQSGFTPPRRKSRDAERLLSLLDSLETGGCDE